MTLRHFISEQVQIYFSLNKLNILQNIENACFKEGSQEGSAEGQYKGWNRRCERKNSIKNQGTDRLKGGGSQLYFLFQAENVMGTCSICKQQIRMIKDNAQV